MGETEQQQELLHGNEAPINEVPDSDVPLIETPSHEGSPDAFEYNQDHEESVPNLYKEIQQAEQHLIHEIHEVESTSGGMPQLDPSSFSSQLFWLVVVFAFLYAFMATAIIPRIRNVLGKRQHQIQHDLDIAEKAREEAQAARSAYEQELQSAKARAAALIASTQKEIEQLLQTEQTKLSASLDAMLSNAEATLEAKRKAARTEIAPMLEVLSAEIASRFLGAKPSQTDVKKALDHIMGGSA